MSHESTEWRYCPFSYPLIIRQFECELAKEVTRRDGPAIACRKEDAQTVCQRLFDELVAATLAAQGLEFDLTQIPASLLKKIQVGGILALDALVSGAGSLPAPATADKSKVESIYAVVQAAKAKNESWSSQHLAAVTQFVEAFQLQRRRQSTKSS